MKKNVGTEDIDDLFGDEENEETSEPKEKKKIERKQQDTEKHQNTQKSAFSGVRNRAAEILQDYPADKRVETDTRQKRIQNHTGRDETPGIRSVHFNLSRQGKPLYGASHRPCRTSGFHY